MSTNNNNWLLQRNDTQESIELPQDMRWLDELKWSKLAQSPPKRTITGDAIVQQGLKLSARPITLGGEWVWLERGDFEILQQWSEVPLLTMTLTHYSGDKYKVMFRNHEAPIDCEPVNFETPEPDDAPYTGEIRLMTTL